MKFVFNLFQTRRIRSRSQQNRLPLVLQVIRQIGFVCLAAVMWLSFSGCSTLSSLGLPVGNSANQILKSANEISEKPGYAIDAPSELIKQPIQTYMIEIGDTIFVEPVSFDSTIRLPGDQVVKPDGTISIGEFGSYDAVYKTVEQCRAEIQSIIETDIRSSLELEFLEEQRQAEQDKLMLAALPARPELEAGDDDSLEAKRSEAFREQEKRNNLERKIAAKVKQNQISVRLVNWDSKRIYVLGEVNSPGYFGFTGNQTVLDAIVEAGGLTSKANNHQIIVSRPTPAGSCREVMKVCYDQVVQLGDTSTNYQLLPGDRVFVPSLTFAEDLKRTFSFNRDPNCPRCASSPSDCNLPEVVTN